MKIKIKKGCINQIAAISLFWGSLWGIAEATLGYLAHLATFIPGLAGFIMFPIGFYFMNRAHRESGKAVSLLSTSTVAAAIKLVDLFLPGPGPSMTINPALAILMEGAAVMIIFRALQKKQRPFRFQEALIAASGWRAAFILYSFALMILSISTDFFQKGMGHILRFFFLDSLVNAVFITAYLAASNIFVGTHCAKYAERIKIRTSSNAGLAFSSLIFAIAVLTRIILARF